MCADFVVGSNVVDLNVVDDEIAIDGHIAGNDLVVLC